MGTVIRILGWIVGAVVAVILLVFVLKGCGSWVAESKSVPTAQSAAPESTPVVKVVTVTITTVNTQTTGSLVPVVQSAAVEQGVCPEKAIRTEPQGVLQADGSFIAQLGNTGCDTIFEGRIWESKPIQSRHDIVLIRGAKDGFRYWEGNGWLLPNGWDVKDVACMLWEGKKTNWISQGITPLPVQFWGFDSALKCATVAALPVPTATVMPITAPVSTTQPVQVVPSVGVLDWAKVLSVPADRLETCPGEAQDRCVHLKDGALVSVQIPVGFKYEGWDGSQVAMGNGPMTVKVSGLTVRPTR